jgi:hypothetical protein
VPTYLVERYWPGVTSGLLLEALDRGLQVMEQMSREGTRVCGISCTLIPGEEVVFSVYEGPSAAAVRQFKSVPTSRSAESSRRSQ